MSPKGKKKQNKNKQTRWTAERVGYVERANKTTATERAGAPKLEQHFHERQEN